MQASSYIVFMVIPFFMQAYILSGNLFTITICMCICEAINIFFFL